MGYVYGETLELLSLGLTPCCKDYCQEEWRGGLTLVLTKELQDYVLRLTCTA